MRWPTQFCEISARHTGRRSWHLRTAGAQPARQWRCTVGSFLHRMVQRPRFPTCRLSWLAVTAASSATSSQRTLAAQAHEPIIQDMLRAYPGSPGAYNYGPICVADSHRGRGLALAMFEVLRARLPGREGFTFIRRDNAASIKVHASNGNARGCRIHPCKQRRMIVVAYIGSTAACTQLTRSASASRPRTCKPRPARYRVSGAAAGLAMPR